MTLLRYDGARDLERGNRQARGDAEHRADQHFLDQHHQNRAQRGRIDVVGVAMQRQQRGRKDERESQPHARRNILLAQARQQHQHGADAREHQEESGAKRRQEGKINTHVATARSLARARLIAADARGDAHKVRIHRVGHERQRNKERDEDRQDFRHKDERGFLNLR